MRVLDEQTIAFPDYDGNGMYLSLGNLVENPQVGMLFIDFTASRRAACASTASRRSTTDDPLLAEYEGAQLIVRVRATSVFGNCPRYIHRMAARRALAPRPASTTSRRSRTGSTREWARGVLKADDPANALHEQDDAEG